MDEKKNDSVPNIIMDNKIVEKNEDEEEGDSDDDDDNDDDNLL